ncbi:MAG: hypothetical protein NVSMB46_00290 [Candidatus Saccharimonadales bacterium]
MRQEFNPSFEKNNPITNESQRIDVFRSTIVDTKIIQPVTFPLELLPEHELPVEKAVNRFMDTGLNTSPTLYLPPSLYEENSTVEGFYPRRSRVGKHSGHGVFFGDIQFDSGRILEVAVKPHWTDPIHSSLIDYVNNVAVNELSIESLRPAGLLIGRGLNTAYSMSILEEELTTFDSVNWKDFYPDTLNNPDMTLSWKKVAQNLAYIHSLGTIHHGDLAARNIAQTISGNVFFIDWERSRISLYPPRDEEVRYSYSHPDLSSLMESMCRPTHDTFKAGIGLFYKKPGDVWEAFNNLVLDDYISDRLYYASKGKHHSGTLQEVASELTVLRESLKNDMIMFQKICDSL